MELLRRSDVKKRRLPGRKLQLVVGDEHAASHSEVMTMGFATYSAESGPMMPHRHAEEIVCILQSEGGWTRYGGSGDEPGELGEKVMLEEGMILHFPEGEWHVFEFEEDGHVDIMFFYAKPGIYSQ